jgi:hypothetical protein
VLSRADFLLAAQDAEADLKEAGLNDDPVPDSVQLAEWREILVEECLPGELRVASRLNVPEYLPKGVTWGMKIFLRHGLSTPQSQFCVAHELGHVRAILRGLVGARAELFANAYAGALLVRAHYLHEQWRRLRDLRAVLEHFDHVPETCTCLRFGETGMSNAVVLDSGGARHMRLPHDTPYCVLRAAHGALSGRRPRSDVRAARLSDAANRVGVVVGLAV